MLAIDTETTGLDLHHGAKPYFVTTCDEEGEQQFWEWDVDPVTRKPHIYQDDLDDINDFIGKVDRILDPSVNGCNIIMHNAKFDVSAFSVVHLPRKLGWPWHRTYDTLIAAHLIASNHPHDLTSLASKYLGVDIQPFEDRLKQACETARRYCRSNFPDWRISKHGLDEMPSLKKSTKKTEEKGWKADAWLLRALRKTGYGPDEWDTLLRDYANADSAVTVELFKVQRDILKKRGHWEIYLECMRAIPVAKSMQDIGITLNADRLTELTKRYTIESKEANVICCGIAKQYDYELVLPKSGNNNSLTTFAFDVLKLPIIKTSKKTDKASLDGKVLEAYIATLDSGTDQLAFVKALQGKRSRDTAVNYMDGYKRFWLPYKSFQDWFLLHPLLNPTGTDTLRWSSSNPNEQNISKKEGFNLRYCFGPAPGREWWSLDAANIELRIPAYESQEKELIALFERPNDPPYYGSEHLLNFSTVYPDIWEMELKEVGIEKVGPTIKKKYVSTWYKRCKNGGFAIGYGSVDRPDGLGTADKAFGRAGSHHRLKARFARKEELNAKWIAFANKHGYVETIPDKTVCPKHGYPLLCQRSYWGGIKPTIPLNYHVQGTAMWWMRKAMVRCHNFLEQVNRCDESIKRITKFLTKEMLKAGYNLIMQVHDELVFDFPKGRGNEPWKTNLPIIKEIKRLMELGGNDIDVPTPVSIEYHADTWADGKTITV